MTGARFARRCHAAAEEGRGGLEALEWARWKPRLVALLEEVGAPSLETVCSCMDPEWSKGGITGPARINAVRSCVTAMVMMRIWLRRFRG
eukprot:5936098-Pyramimonas_sp.AAC.1